MATVGRPVIAAPAAPVSLPQWYARVSFDVRDRAHASMSGVPCRHAGPFTVYRPETAEALLWANGTRALIFDGYLFDRERTARELGCAEQASNATLVSAAFDRHGTGVFDALDGCYVAAIWDGETGRLIAGHDALGRHPVFYARTADALWLSSNVLSLAASGAVPVEPNRVSLALLGLRYWPEAGETFFQAVRRVRPGHYLVATAGGTPTEHRHWDPLPADDEPWLPEAQVLDEFEPALTRAVERCLSLTPQGIMLSGGVDSVTIAALACAHLRAHGQPPLVAVSGRTGGPLSSEEVMQSRVTAALGMPHVISTTPEWRRGRDHVRLSLDVTPELPSPSNVYWVGTYTGFYRRTAADGLRVLLTGSGGDNWLSVGDAHAADLLARGRGVQLYRFLRSDMTTGGAALNEVLYRRLWAFGIRPHVDVWWARLAPARKRRYHRRRWEERLPAWLAPDRELREDVIERLLARRTPALAADGRAPRSHYRHALRSYANPYMHHENETAFHVDALCGVRLLSPYHDKRLVSFFNRIAPATLVHGTRYKGLLRPVVARHLPSLGLDRQRKDYPADHAAEELAALRSSITAVWPDYQFDILAGLGVVDASRLSAERGAFHRAGFDGLARMYGLLSAERWLQARSNS
ncbi:MAG: hypothetical protein IT184_03035 [Acidobacteria bacterium]|nr:hypothetical protein [Acidobacteriota bacterium]